MNRRKSSPFRNFTVWAWAAVFSLGALAAAQDDQSQATIEADVYGSPDVHVSGSYDRSPDQVSDQAYPDQGTQGQYDQETTRDDADRNDPPGRAAKRPR